jgi:c-di-GMP-binding flagellar brake protein YcgR
MTPNIGERRKHPRALIEWPVTIKTKRTVMEGVTLNISAGGATIRCEKPQKSDEVLEMTIRIPEAGSSLVVGAEVVWSSADISDDELKTPSMGVRFTDIADHHRWFISSAVMMSMKQEKSVPPLNK